MKYLKRFISLITILAAALSMPFSALALDDSCISQRSYFNNCENIILINNDGLNATAKYIADSDEGCFYFKIKFVDSIMSGGDEIHFKFIISNTLEAISFDVDESGIASYTSQNTQSKVNVISELKISEREKGGSAIIGFELKDKAYRKLLNNISCSYYCGDKRFVNILNCVELDMYEEESTTIKSTTTGKSITKADKRTSVAVASSKSTTKATTQPNTKFTPSKVTSAQAITQSTSKFAADSTRAQNGTQAEAPADTAPTQSDEEYWSEAMAGINTEASSPAPVNSQSLKTSTLAKYILASGIIVILTGVTMLVIGISKKDNATSKEQNAVKEASEE